MKKLQRFISFICLIIVLLACSLLPSPTEPQSEIPTEIPLLIAEDETSAAEEADDVVSTAVEVEESKGDQTKTDGGDTDASEMVSEADEEESAEPTPQVNTAALVLADPAEMGVDVTLAVDITNPLHRISPMVYGVNFGEEDFILDANIPVRRWGGNATTRYNWETDVSNRASDWFYLNVPNELDDPSTLPFGSGADHFVGFNEDNSIETMKMISKNGCTPRGRERSCSVSVHI